MLLNIIVNEKSIIYIIAGLILLAIAIFFIAHRQNKKNQIQENKSPQEINREELSNLHDVSKELENIAKQKQIEMTPYEEEQEEKAIISYDELLSRTQNVSISYSDTSVSDDISIKKVDLEKTGKIELDPIKKEINTKIPSISYAHEEEFLNTLKQLQELIS